MNDSQYPFSQGLPGSIYNVLTSRLDNHSRSFSAINSGPLSERINLGCPRIKNCPTNSDDESCNIYPQLLRPDVDDDLI